MVGRSRTKTLLICRTIKCPYSSSVRWLFLLVLHSIFSGDTYLGISERINRYWHLAAACSTLWLSGSETGPAGGSKYKASDDDDGDDGGNNKRRYDNNKTRRHYVDVR